MNRRQLIKHIAVLTGASVVGGEFFLTGCKSADKPITGMFGEGDILFFDEVAETIIPRTGTPGAKDAEVGKFMALYSNDCYEKKNLEVLKSGIGKLNEAAEKMFSDRFVQLSNEQKHKLLVDIDAEAKEYVKDGEKDTVKDRPPHYFTLMKQLVLLGFFTSKPGATQVLRYRPVPGKYEGCIDYSKGETAWA